MESKGRDVLDPPLSRRMTSCGEAATCDNGRRRASSLTGSRCHQADVRLCFAASNAASRSANLPFAAPARAMMMGTGNVSKK